MQTLYFPLDSDKHDKYGVNLTMKGRASQEATPTLRLPFTTTPGISRPGLEQSEVSQCKPAGSVQDNHNDVHDALLDPRSRSRPRSFAPDGSVVPRYVPSRRMVISQVNP